MCVCVCEREREIVCVCLCIYIYIYIYIFIYVIHRQTLSFYCYEIAEGFRFMPLSLVGLGTFPLSTWVS